MLLTLCKSKINRATVTQTELHYNGSITIDRTLAEAANLGHYERVQVLNLNNGERLETYVIIGPENSGVICLNGPAARCGVVGDIVTIISYAMIDEKETQDWHPTVVNVDAKNRIVAKQLLPEYRDIS
jgi:aspartate 1-decarboxylase